jgi:hypothetical protein
MVRGRFRAVPMCDQPAADGSPCERTATHAGHRSGQVAPHHSASVRCSDHAAHVPNWVQPNRNACAWVGCVRSGKYATDSGDRVLDSTPAGWRVESKWCAEHAADRLAGAGRPIAPRATTYRLEPMCTRIDNVRCSKHATFARRRGARPLFVEDATECPGHAGDSRGFARVDANAHVCAWPSCRSRATSSFSFDRWHGANLMLGWCATHYAAKAAGETPPGSDADSDADSDASDADSDDSDADSDADSDDSDGAESEADRAHARRPGGPAHPIVLDDRDDLVDRDDLNWEPRRVRRLRPRRLEAEFDRVRDRTWSRSPSPIRRDVPAPGAPRKAGRARRASPEMSRGVRRRVLFAGSLPESDA